MNMAPNPDVSSQTDTEDPLLTRLQVARWLNVTVQTVRSRIPGTKVGRVWRYRRSDVQTYLDNNREDRSSAA